MEARWEEVLLGAALADVKDAVYRNTLALAAVLDVLAEKGVLTPGEVRRASARLDGHAAAGWEAAAPPGLAARGD